MVKRQCSSDTFMKSKATVELPKQDREQQARETKKKRKHRALALH